MKGEFSISIGWAEGTEGEGQQVFYKYNGAPAVSFYVSYFPGQCGGRILYAFNFLNSNEDWWQDFVDDLKLWAKGSCCKLIASAVDQENGPELSDYSISQPLHKLLTDTQWEYGSSAENPNSGNHVRVFELTVE